MSHTAYASAMPAEAAAFHPAVRLSAYRRVATDSVDAAAEEVGRIFCPHELRPQPGHDRAFHALHNCARFDGFSVNYVAYGGTVAIDPGCLEHFFLLQLPLTGRALIDAGDGDVATAPGEAASLLSPTRPTRMLWQDDCSQAILLLDRHLVEQRAAALAGSARRAVEFDTRVDLAAPGAQRLATTVGELIALAERLPAGRSLSPLAAADWRERLIEALLRGHRHDLTPLMARHAGEAAPAALRRARDHLQAHADEAFDLDRLAAVAGIGIRALQAGFRRHFGCTVSDMLREIRLDLLHARLIRAPDDVSVTDLAYDLGFNHLSRMAQAYRQKFGETPSATLRRGGRASLQKLQA
jgi:AraC-like DNA-binding protein